MVDPGDEFERIRDELTRAQLTVTALIHTHTHLDHVGATAPLQQFTGAEAHIHEADRFLYDMLPLQSVFLGLPLPKKCEMLGTLADGFTLHAGALEVCVLHTPGHTPGSCCFQVSEGDQRYVFTGDTLFQRGVGRTDLWGGDSAALSQSLKQRLMTLPPQTVVVPGHGPNTNVGDELQSNPFLRRLAK